MIDEELLEPSDYRVIDISTTVIPGKDPNRPFAIQRHQAADNTYMHDVYRTHSHVGTHVEGGTHFYGDEEDEPGTTTVSGKQNNNTIADYPLERFYGSGVLFPVTEMEITAEYCEETIGDDLSQDDIVVVRNDTGNRDDLSLGKAYSPDGPPAPTFTRSGAQWLADHGVKALVLGKVSLGSDYDENNVFHDILMSEGVVFIELVENLEEITRSRFNVMALPYKVEGLDSSFCRAIVIEKR